MANADTPDDALTARNNGAEGIGLCRTEHMVIDFVYSYCGILLNLSSSFYTILLIILDISCLFASKNLHELVVSE